MSRPSDACIEKCGWEKEDTSKRYSRIFYKKDNYFEDKQKVKHPMKYLDTWCDHWLYCPNCGAKGEVE